jgi:hypothetical protein
MPKAIKQTEYDSITLKEWVYSADGKEIQDLIKTSFVEFYFLKKTAAIQ